MTLLAPRRSRKENQDRLHDGAHHGENTGLRLASWHRLLDFCYQSSNLFFSFFIGLRKEPPHGSVAAQLKRKQGRQGKARPQC